MLVGTNKHKHRPTRLPKYIHLLRLCLRHYSAVVGLRVCFWHVNNKTPLPLDLVQNNLKKPTDGTTSICSRADACQLSGSIASGTRVSSASVFTKKNRLQLFYEGAPFWQTRRSTVLEGQKKHGVARSKKNLVRTKFRCIRRHKKARCPGI